MTYKIKESKKYFVLGITCGIFIQLFFLTICIFSCVKYVVEENRTFSQLSGYIFLIVFSIIIILLVLAGIIYAYWYYKFAVDIYQENSVLIKIKEKLIVEISYKDIVSIVEGPMDSFTIFCKDWTKKANGKKGPRTFVRHYTKKDIHCIKKIIANRYFHINFK